MALTSRDPRSGLTYTYRYNFSLRRPRDRAKRSPSLPKTCRRPCVEPCADPSINRICGRACCLPKNHPGVAHYCGDDSLHSSLTCSVRALLRIWRLLVIREPPSDPGTSDETQIWKGIRWAAAVRSFLSPTYDTFRSWSQESAWRSDWRDNHRARGIDPAHALHIPRKLRANLRWAKVEDPDPPFNVGRGWTLTEAEALLREIEGPDPLTSYLTPPERIVPSDIILRWGLLVVASLDEAADEPLPLAHLRCRRRGSAASHGVRQLAMSTTCPDASLGQAVDSNTSSSAGGPSWRLLRHFPASACGSSRGSAHRSRSRTERSVIQSAFGCW